MPSSSSTIDDSFAKIIGGTKAPYGQRSCKNRQSLFTFSDLVSKNV